LIIPHKGKKRQFPKRWIAEILSFILVLTSLLGVFPSLFSSGIPFPTGNTASALAQSTLTVQPYEITTRGNLPYPATVQGNGYNNKYPLLKHSAIIQ
jgi:hypothetical protein